MTENQSLEILQKTYDGRNDIVTIFSQGFGASRNQGSKYGGKDGITVTGSHPHKSIMANSPKLLYGLFAYEELCEIGYGFTLNPIHWVIQIASFYIIWYRLIKGAKSYYIRFSKVNLAGKNDVLQHQKALYSCIKKNDGKKKKIVLFGCSKGASLTLTSVSLMEKKLKSKISLVILEAPFDSIENFLKKKSFLSSIPMLFLKIFTDYKNEYTTPEEATRNFPLNIPVVFVTSKCDEIMPLECTTNLIKILKDRGHPNVHHLDLDKSHHSQMSIGNAEDQLKYKKFLENLYDKYC